MVDMAFFEDRKGGHRTTANGEKRLEEQHLEEEVFGSSALPAGDAARGLLFAAGDEDGTEGGKPAVEGRVRHRQPVWRDEDDAGLEIDISAQGRLRKLRKSETDGVVGGEEYTERLRQFHRKVAGPKGDWAALPSLKRGATRSRKEPDGGGGLSENDEWDDQQSEEENIALERFKRSTQVVGDDRYRGSLPPGRLDVRRVRDANCEDYCRSIVTSVQFHPISPLLLVSGLDKSVRVFRVDGTDNPKLAGIHFGDLPVRTAKFTRGGNEIVAAGERKFFYQYDLASGATQKIKSLSSKEEKHLRKFAASHDGEQLAFLGDNGRVYLVTSRSKQETGFVKMNAPVLDAAFTGRDNELLTVGGDGMVYRWDLRMRRCTQRHVDEGSVKSTSIGTAPHGGLYACGSDSGVVNLYDSTSGDDIRTPQKAFLNLTTQLDGVVFSPNSEMMAFFSPALKGAFRIAHVASRSVFSNFPTQNINLRHVFCADFSPQCGYLAVGNDKGATCLFRLNHYPAS